MCRKRRKEEQPERWQLRDHLAGFFELPKEIIFNMPHITIIGDMQLHLENHRGVIEYTEELVRVSTNNGEVIIRGCDLSIKRLFSEEILVEGSIKTVEFER